MCPWRMPASLWYSKASMTTTPAVMLHTALAPIQVQHSSHSQAVRPVHHALCLASILHQFHLCYHVMLLSGHTIHSHVSTHACALHQVAPPHQQQHLSLTWLASAGCQACAASNGMTSCSRTSLQQPAHPALSGQCQTLHCSAAHFLL